MLVKSKTNEFNVPVRFIKSKQLIYYTGPIPVMTIHFKTVSLVVLTL